MCTATMRMRFFVGAGTAEVPQERATPRPGLVPESTGVRSAFEKVREAAAKKDAAIDLAKVLDSALPAEAKTDPSIAIARACLEDPLHGLSVTREESLHRARRDELVILVAETELLRGGVVGIEMARMSRLVRLLNNTDADYVDRSISRLMRSPFTYPVIQHLLGQDIAARMIRGRDSRAETLATEIVTERGQDEVGATFGTWLIRHMSKQGIRHNGAIALVQRLIEPAQSHQVRDQIVTSLAGEANVSKIATDLLLHVIDEPRQGTPLRERALRALCELKPEHWLAWQRVEQFASIQDHPLRNTARGLLRGRSVQ